MDEVTLGDVNRSLVELTGTVGLAVAALSRERWWRKVAGVLVCLGFVSILIFVSWTRQADCDRGNQVRVLLNEQVNSSLPLRDCSWPA